ncbi:MAG: hypothetical protein BZ136_09565 [Methanosphaera sp. rholeuAM74]|nr:MAG: hypothetical protein BZ136_09565 [Methanosphaera sp. rholeuAM74]
MTRNAMQRSLRKYLPWMLCLLTLVFAIGEQDRLIPKNVSAVMNAELPGSTLLCSDSKTIFQFVEHSQEVGGVRSVQTTLQNESGVQLRLQHSHVSLVLLLLLSVLIRILAAKTSKIKTERESRKSFPCAVF